MDVNEAGIKMKITSLDLKKRAVKTGKIGDCPQFHVPNSRNVKC